MTSEREVGIPAWLRKKAEAGDLEVTFGPHGGLDFWSVESGPMVISQWTLVDCVALIRVGEWRLVHVRRGRYRIEVSTREDQAH